MTPRLAHNADLAKKFGLGAEYPAVAQQLEAVPLNRRDLHPYAYNPSIVRWNDRILMAYRYHPVASEWKTRLAMAEFDANFKFIGRKEIALPASVSNEDAHLFVHMGLLWMNWVESPAPARAVVKYGPLHEGTDWTAAGFFQPKYGHNDGKGIEKNWVFYGDGEHVRFIYQAAPLVICQADGNEAERIFEEKQPHWPFGRRAGGTPFLPLADTLIRFWHSSLDNESNPDAINNPLRRYYIGATVYDQPLRPVEQSRLPILRGSEASSLSETEIASVRHYKSNVVFCSGAIVMPDGSIILSVGINDSECALLRAKDREDLVL
jgi:hypothetical protein